MIDLDKYRSVAILGDIDTCKTNLAFYLLRGYKGTRSIYLYGYPKPVDNFKLISVFNDLHKIRNSIIFIDELQRFVPTYDRKTNQDFLELISFMAHQNNTIIFTTQLSQFVTRSMEAFIDCWCITRVNDLVCLKNGSKPKRIIQNTNTIKKTSWSLALDKGEFLFFSELNDTGESGLRTFEDQKIPKDWKV